MQAAIETNSCDYMKIRRYCLTVCGNCGIMSTQCAGTHCANTLCADRFATLTGKEIDYAGTGNRIIAPGAHS